jgi:hypothetical protein
VCTLSQVHVPRTFRVAFLDEDTKVPPLRPSPYANPDGTDRCQATNSQRQTSLIYLDWFLSSE